MLKEVPGFKDYTCKYEINKKNVVSGKSKDDKII